MLARELDQAAAPVDAQRASTRVLEGRDRVQEARLRPCRERVLERIEVEPVVVHRDRLHLRVVRREKLQRPVVRGLLDQHAVAGEALGEERDALQRAVRDEHPLGLDAVTLGDPFA